MRPRSVLHCFFSGIIMLIFSLKLNIFSFYSVKDK